MSLLLLDELHAIMAGLVGGLRYGFKIRLPHAFVMTALFRRDLTVEQKMTTIWKLTREHAINLAAFAAIYKVRKFDMMQSLGVLLHSLHNVSCIAAHFNVCCNLNNKSQFLRYSSSRLDDFINAKKTIGLKHFILLVASSSP